LLTQTSWFACKHHNGHFVGLTVGENSYQKLLVFDGVEMCLQCFKDNLFRTLFLGQGNFCYSSFDLVDFVHGFHIYVAFEGR